MVGTVFPVRIWRHIDLICSDEGGGTGPQITFQDGMDMDQALPASEARTPGFAIGDIDYGNRPAGESA